MLGMMRWFWWQCGKDGVTISPPGGRVAVAFVFVPGAVQSVVFVPGAVQAEVFS